MIESVDVIGVRGRVGTAVSARLAERGVDLRGGGAAIVLLCVPDRAIAEVAASIEPGPWVAHVSGGTPLAALDPHARRFRVHPLQTLHARAAAPSSSTAPGRPSRGETDEALEVGYRARRAARPRDRSRSPTTRRSLYHAGAAIASNYLVTLRRAAGELLASGRRAAGGARPAHAADDRERLRAHRAHRRAATGRPSSGTSTAIQREHPELEAAYDALAGLTAGDAASQGSRA